jgi:hypothetical protein
MTPHLRCIVRNDIQVFWHDDYMNRQGQSLGVAEKAYKDTKSPEWLAVVDQIKENMKQTPNQPIAVSSPLEDPNSIEAVEG